MMDLDDAMIDYHRKTTRFWTKMYFCGLVTAESYDPIWNSWVEYWKKRGMEPPLI